jgi:endo-1,4-beta-xylanase
VRRRRALLVVLVVVVASGGLAGCTLAQVGGVSSPPVRIGLFGDVFSPPTRQVMARESSAVVNPIAWNLMEPQPNVFDFGPADGYAALAEEHRLEQVAMAFAWDQALLDDLPAWVGDLTHPDELRGALVRRAETIFDRYPGIDRVNVVNEPLETFAGGVYHNHFAAVLGDDYVAELFAIVDAAAPDDVELFLNENFVEYLPAKADGLVALVDELVAAGVPIDGVGLQAHFLFGAPDFDLLATTGSRLEALGVKVFLTELDVPVPANVADRARVQADRYRGAVETCLRWRTCDLINVWGVDDGHTWIDAVLGPGTDPLLFDRELRPKLAYWVVRQTLLAGREAVG